MGNSNFNNKNSHNPFDNVSDDDDDLFDDIEPVQQGSPSQPQHHHIATNANNRYQFDNSPYRRSSSYDVYNNNPFVGNTSYTNTTTPPPMLQQQQQPALSPLQPPLFNNNGNNNTLYQQQQYKKYRTPTSSNSNSSYSTMVDNDEFQLSRKKTVAFTEPEYPPLTYSPEEMDDGSLVASGGSGGIHADFAGDDYIINPLQDADDDDSLDPFGDDESLFSDTGEEILRRGTTIKKRHSTRRGRRNGTLKRGKSRNTEYGGENEKLVNNDNGDEEDGDGDDDDDDFKPKLTYTKTIKKAKLINGNYVIDAPVPKTLLETYGKKINYHQDNVSREMSFVRYTAATCGPSNYVKFNYNLRQELYAPSRQTEIMICITMYNEDEVLLARTLKGVFENIRDLTNRSDPNWGDDSWKKIVVCIVNDGRLELNKRTETLLAALGIFQDGYAKSKINDKSVKAHIYEYTSTVGIDAVNDKVHLACNSTPVQFLFCLKEKNSRKINSHRWCFQAFAPILNPKVIMLLDCGTKPSRDAFFHLWKSFKDPNVAGACGEMRVALGPNKNLLMNPLVAAQNFEYKISNVLDKPMESVFGFISVLPGAFSAYRYEALLNVNGEGPLEKYFKGEYLHQMTTEGIFTSNMYLAEDRILCFELVAKKNHNYILRYVNEAKAETDVPENIDEFVLQRRRWLNGSMFAAGYAVSIGQRFGVPIILCLEIISSIGILLPISYNFGVLVFISKFLFGFPKFYLVIAVFFAILMAYMMFAAIFLAVHTVNSIVHNHKTDFTIALVFTNTKFRDLVVSMVSTYLLYFIGAFMYGEPSFMFTSFAQYVLLSPTYINVLNIYAFCNIHDVSWGTKGVEQAKDLGSAKSFGKNSDELVMIAPENLTQELNDKYVATLENLRTMIPVKDIPQESNKKKDDLAYYAFIRTITVLVWMLTNAILIAIVLEAGGVDILSGNKSGQTNADGSISGNSQVFLTIILWIVAGLALFRFIGAFLFLIFKSFRPLKWKLRAKRENKRNRNQNRNV
ncbi:Chitin synthase family protein [Candida albicans]|uniref:chitin synthase n=1 Tax=Candida albicans TaxID=5476 RepID=A0A8H6C420_CANAX|nr:Chitin synthase family protein [Candida albicans]